VLAEPLKVVQVPPRYFEAQLNTTDIHPLASPWRWRW